MRDHSDKTSEKKVARELPLSTDTDVGQAKCLAKRNRPKPWTDELNLEFPKNYRWIASAILLFLALLYPTKWLLTDGIAEETQKTRVEEGGVQSADSLPIDVDGVGADPIASAQGDASLIATGKALFQTKICFTCHQIDPKIPSPAGVALKAPGFIGKFWGTEREVHVGVVDGPIEKVTMNEAYFLESVEKPMAKILKGAIPGMAPMPTTPEERNALLAYVKSLSKEGGAIPAADPEPVAAAQLAAQGGWETETAADPEPVAAAQPTPTDTPKAPPPPQSETMSEAAPDSARVAKGKELFQTKACFTCHQTDPAVPSPAGPALKAPNFMGDFWGKERNVHLGVGGPVEKVVMDKEYFMESVEDPMAKIYEGSLPGMAPLPTTPEERENLAAYVQSLSGVEAQQANVVSAVPSGYWPTILIGMLLLLGLTWVGLKSGTKEVEVR